MFQYILMILLLGATNFFMGNPPKLKNGTLPLPTHNCSLDEILKNDKHNTAIISHINKTPQKYIWTYNNSWVTYNQHNKTWTVTINGKKIIANKRNLKLEIKKALVNSETNFKSFLEMHCPEDQKNSLSYSILMNPDRVGRKKNNEPMQMISCPLCQHCNDVTRAIVKLHIITTHIHFVPIATDETTEEEIDD